MWGGNGRPPPVVLWCFGGPGSPCLQARPHCGTSHSSQHTCVASSPATQVCLKLLTTPSPSCQCLLASDDCPVTFPVSLFNAWQTPTLASKPSCNTFSGTFPLISSWWPGTSAQGPDLRVAPVRGSSWARYTCAEQPWAPAAHVSSGASVLSSVFTGGSDRNPLKA